MKTSLIQRVEKELAKFSKDTPAVFQLQSIPGVGLRTAETTTGGVIVQFSENSNSQPLSSFQVQFQPALPVAFIDDPNRFQSSKQVGAYFGLVPSQDQSANKNRLGHITRQGSAAARAMLTVL